MRWSLIYLVAYFAAMWGRTRLPGVGDVLYLTLYGSAHLFATVLCFAHGCKTKGIKKTHRFGWAFLGTACLTYTLGNLTYLFAMSPLSGKCAFPAFSDFWWLCFAPCVLAGVVLLSDTISGIERWRLSLDSALTSGSIGAVIWYFAIQSVWGYSSLGIFAKSVAVAFPTLDLLALGASFFLLGGIFLRQEFTLGKALLAVGCLSWTLSDLAYCLQLLQGKFHYGGIGDAGWAISGLSFGVSAYLHHLAKVPSAQQVTEPISESRNKHGYRMQLRMSAPYLTLCLALVVLTSQDYSRAGKITQGTSTFCALLGTLVLLRQLFTLRENRLLTETITGLNEKLELRVRQRTRQLDGLLNLTRALSNAAEIQEVIAAALAYTRTAFDARATVMWLCSPSDPSSPGFCHHAGLEKEPELIRSLSLTRLSETHELIPLPNNEGDCLRVPILWHGERLGMLGIILTDSEANDINTLPMLHSMSSEVGASLSNAYQHQVAMDTADRDAVTGLFNHRAIQQRLDVGFETARAAEVPLTLMMLDVTNFRLFNETHGHQTGDSILYTVGQAIMETLPTDSYVGRYGGDEYLAVLLGISADEAMRYAEELQVKTEQLGFRETNDERVIPVFVACGIASYPADCPDRQALLMLAHRNLEEAKQHGERIRATTAIHHLLEELRSDAEFETLDAMVTAVDNKDSYTRRHSEDMTQYALWIAEELGITDEPTLRNIRIGGLLHDVGKIGVSTSILCKPGRLNEKEYENLKRHPRLGALIVGSVPGMDGVIDAVKSHHERWDGKGYPDATAETDTPWLGRLMAVADAFSAMTTNRPYRKGMAIRIAVSEIEKGSGTQFDPDMADAFLRAVRKRFPSLAKPETVDVPLRKAA